MYKKVFAATALMVFLLVNTMAQSPLSGFGEQPKEFSKLIERGNFTPSATLTKEVANFQSFKKGWLVNFNLNVFIGSYYDQIRAGVNPPPPSIFNLKYVNVDAWADSAIAHGINYIVVTFENEYGFKLWNSRTPYNMKRINLPIKPGGFMSPFYDDYDVQNNFDTGLVKRVVTTFRSRGIEVIPYINSVGDYNVLGGGLPNTNIPESRIMEFINYKSRLLQEQILTFNFHYVWIDYAASVPAGLAQAFYNAVKSVDSTCQVIGNVLGTSEYGRWPFDIASTEEHSLYASNTFYQSDTYVHNGTTYYAGQELVATPYGEMSQWYYYDQKVSYLPGENPFTNKPPWYSMLETDKIKFQGIVTSSRKFSRPFLAAVFIDRNGVLVPATLDYLRQIDFK
jgi:hypothetical protein